MENAFNLFCAVTYFNTYKYDLVGVFYSNNQLVWMTMFLLFYNKAFT